MSDLITYVEELHFNKQKLEEENNQLKLALETLEEANSRLSEDCTELRLQIKRWALEEYSCGVLHAGVFRVALTLKNMLFIEI